MSNEFLTAARGMGWTKYDFACMFDVLAAMSGVTTPVTAGGQEAVTTVTSKPEAGRDTLDGERQWLRAYRQMVRIRLFEEQVNELYTRALMPGLAHLYSGEEAVAVGICEALRIDDYITSTHRGHGHCLAKGAAPDRMFAELLGKEAGYCRGKGGSMHIADPATGNLGANAIVGGSVGIATGAAFAAKRLGNGRVAVCFFGEGALGQGSLYEVMNLAQLWKLPVIYVCENNLYNEYTHYSETTAGDDPRPRSGFRHRAAQVSMDRTCARSMQSRPRLVERARAGEGPAFLQADTYRYQRPSRRRHQSRILSLASRKSSTGRPNAIPSSCIADWLLEQEHADPAALERIDRRSAQPRWKRAVKFAIAAPYPDRRASGRGRLCLNA